MRTRPRRSMRAPLLRLFAALIVLAAAPAAAQRWAIDDPGQGPVLVASGPAGARELSGLAWAGGDRYLAASDDDGRLFWLLIAVDPATGRITSATAAPGMALAGSEDVEGVALTLDGRSAV